MKVEFEFTLDDTGNPCIKFRHHDKDNSLEQKTLKIFIDLARQKGIDLVNINGYLDSEGNSWENYQLRIRN
jgi:hypothetical protein